MEGSSQHRWSLHEGHGQSWSGMGLDSVPEHLKGVYASPPPPQKEVKTRPQSSSGMLWGRTQDTPLELGDQSAHTEHLPVLFCCNWSFPLSKEDARCHTG